MNAREVVRGVLLDGRGRVLLLLVADDSGERAWALPGGAVEAGEDDAAALARELREELRLDTARIGRLIAKWEVPFSRGGETALWRTRVYACESDGRPVVPEFASWWSRTELLDSGQRFLPSDLPAVLAAVL